MSGFGSVKAGVLASLGASAVGLTMADPAEAQLGVTPADSSVGLEEVVVTAQKRESTIQKTPAVVEVVSGDELVRNQISRVADLSTLVPGLTVADSGQGGVGFFLRGIGGGQGAIDSSRGVTLNIDQVYLPRSEAFQSSLFDVYRVEVLEGPQGTLYGRDAAGGTVNVVTRKPQPGTFEANGSMSLGDFDYFRTEGAVNVPLGERFAIRGAALNERRDGYLSNRLDDQENLGARLQAFGQVSDAFDIRLNASYFHQGGTGSTIVPRPAQQGDAWYTPYNPTGARQDLTVRMYSGEINWRVGGDLSGVTFTYIPSHTETRLNQYLVTNSTSGPAQVLTYHPYNSKVDTHEARLAGDNGRLQWVGGLYYYQESVPNFLYLLQNAASPLNPPLALTNTTRDDIGSRAAFAQATLSLLQNLRLTAGLRYDKDLKSLTAFSPVLKRFVNYPYHWDGIDWKGGLEVDLSRSSLLYASASTGHLAGGASSPGLPSLPATFGPQHILAYALGSKNRFWDERLQANLEGFYYNYTHYQASATAPGCADPNNPATCTLGGYTINLPGTTHIYGTDLHITARLTRADQIGLAASYLHAYFGPYVIQGIPPNTPSTLANLATFDFTGEQIPQSPRWSGTASYQHIFALSNGAQIVAEAQAQFRQRYWLDVNHIAPNAAQPGYGRTDLSLTYFAPSNCCSVSLWVRNVSNVAVYTNTSVNRYGGAIQPPRTFGVTVTANLDK